MPRLSLIFIGITAFLLSAIPAPAQMDKPAEAKTPSAPAPVHSLIGVWNANDPPAMRRFIGNTWTPEGPSLTPWGEEKFKEAKASNGGTYTLETTNDPVISRCYPPGVPRIYMQPFPFEVAENPGEILFIYEYDHSVRHVMMDVKHPDDVDPTYMGNSVGHWEDDNTLVVDTIGFNEKTWLDRIGHPHSDQLHVIERFHRVDHDHLQIQVTMEDPKAMTKPWSQTISYILKPEWHIMEQVCTDNEDFLKFEK